MTTACLKLPENDPSTSDKLMSLVIDGRRTPRHSARKWGWGPVMQDFVGASLASQLLHKKVGMGSSKQDFVGASLAPQLLHKKVGMGSSKQDFVGASLAPQLLH